MTVPERIAVYTVLCLAYIVFLVWMAQRAGAHIKEERRRNDSLRTAIYIDAMATLHPTPPGTETQKGGPS